MERRTKLRVIAVAGIAILIAALLLLSIFDLRITGTRVEMQSMDASGLADSMQYYRLAQKQPDSAAEQIVRKDNPYPTQDPSCYRDVYVYVDIKNSGFLNRKIYDAVIDSEMDDDSRIILRDGCLVTQSVGAFKQSNGVYAAHMVLYTEDMTDDQISEYLKAIDFKLITSGRSQVFRLESAVFSF